MSVHEVSVSLDTELLAEAKELAGPRGLWSLINDALRVRLQQVRVIPERRAEGPGGRADRDALRRAAGRAGADRHPDDLGPLLADSPEVTVLRSTAGIRIRSNEMYNSPLMRYTI